MHPFQVTLAFFTFNNLRRLTCICHYRLLTRLRFCELGRLSSSIKNAPRGLTVSNSDDPADAS